MEQYSEIEQVGFVSNLKNSPHLDMMGGEFCGNASRCVAYEIFSKKGKTAVFSVSGYKGKVFATNNRGQISIILKSDFLENIQPHPLGHVVNLQGISFLLTAKKNIGMTPEAFLKKFSLGHSATGLLRLVKKSDGYYIYPVIYVPATKTLVEESACASGSIAAVLVLNKLGKGKVFSVVQPSGKKFKVALGLKNKMLDIIKFSGPLVFEGTGFIDI